MSPGYFSIEVTMKALSALRALSIVIGTAVSRFPFAVVAEAAREQDRALASLTIAITAIELHNPVAASKIVPQLKRVASYIKTGYNECPHLVAKYGTCSTCGDPIHRRSRPKSQATLRLVTNRETGRIRLSDTLSIRPDLRAVAAPRVEDATPSA